MQWITNWAEIDDDKNYVVFAIGSTLGVGYYVYKPELYKGWAVKRLMSLCYAALELPPFHMPNDE